MPSPPARKLVPGIYTPIPTFFHPPPAQAIDEASVEAHVRWIGGSGVKGLVIFGSTGEHITLTGKEREALFKLTRATLDASGHGSMPIIWGLAPTCLRDAVDQSAEAAALGADFILSLTPHYWAPAMNREAIREFYSQLADASSLPILIYSYPSVVTGIDLDSDLLGELALHPNIVGVKQTDHNMGKLARVGQHSPVAKKCAAAGTQWIALGGATDYLIGSVALGGMGAITGMGNLTPRVCVELYNLASAGKYKEAAEMQGVLAHAEFIMAKEGLPATKHCIAHFRRMPESACVPRLPVKTATSSVQQWINARLQDVVGLEIALQERDGAKEGLFARPLAENVTKSAGRPHLNGNGVPSVGLSAA